MLAAGGARCSGSGTLLRERGIGESWKLERCPLELQCSGRRQCGAVGSKNSRTVRETAPEQASPLMEVKENGAGRRSVERW